MLSITRLKNLYLFRKRRWWRWRYSWRGSCVQNLSDWAMWRRWDIEDGMLLQRWTCLGSPRMRN